MRHRTLRAHVALLLLITASALQLACAGPRIFGKIPPSTFQFHNVVPYSGTTGGGWKVAQVLVLLGRISPRLPETAYCDVEVGVPEVNWRGPISDERAQIVAANAADNAAAQVLTKRLVTAVLCDQFREKMQFVMNAAEKNKNMDYLPGSTVTRFRSWPIEIVPTKFP